MKKIKSLLYFLLLVGCYSNTESCDPGPVSPPNLSKYKPIIVKRTDFEKNVLIEDAKDVSESSKIYIIDSLIFVNDKLQGFHIFDNKDPKKPVKKKFLNIPGSTDIAVRNNTFYINQATDLVTLSFNYTDYSFEIKKRIKNVFPQMLSPDGYSHGELKEDEVIVGWKLK